MADQNSVTLEFVDDCPPYFKGDVAVFTKAEAEMILNPVVTDVNGKSRKVATKVVVSGGKADKAS